jgi:hypothetical protein
LTWSANAGASWYLPAAGCAAVVASGAVVAAGADVAAGGCVAAGAAGVVPPLHAVTNIEADAKSTKYFSRCDGFLMVNSPVFLLECFAQNEQITLLGENTTPPIVSTNF